jgi:hypothetical protein
MVAKLLKLCPIDTSIIFIGQKWDLKSILWGSLPDFNRFLLYATSMHGQLDDTPAVMNG